MASVGVSFDDFSESFRFWPVIGPCGIAVVGDSTLIGVNETTGESFEAIGGRLVAVVEEAYVLFTVLGVGNFCVGAFAIVEVAVGVAAAFVAVSEPIIVFASFSNCFDVIHPGGQMAKNFKIIKCHQLFVKLTFYFVFEVFDNPFFTSDTTRSGNTIKLFLCQYKL